MKKLINEAEKIVLQKEIITFNPNPIATVSVWDGKRIKQQQKPVDSAYWDYEADEIYLDFTSGAGECLLDLPKNEQIEICKLIIKKGE